MSLLLLKPLTVPSNLATSVHKRIFNRVRTEQISVRSVGNIQTLGLPACLEPCEAVETIEPTLPSDVSRVWLLCCVRDEKDSAESRRIRPPVII